LVWTSAIRWSCYCVLDEAGEILLEQKVATTPEAMKELEHWLVGKPVQGVVRGQITNG